MFPLVSSPGGARPRTVFGHNVQLVRGQLQLVAERSFGEQGGGQKQVHRVPQTIQLVRVRPPPAVQTSVSRSLSAAMDAAQVSMSQLSSGGVQPSPQHCHQLGALQLFRLGAVEHVWPRHVRVSPDARQGRDYG